MISYFSNYSGSDALLCEIEDRGGNYCCKSIARFQICDHENNKRIFCPEHAVRIRDIIRGKYNSYLYTKNKLKDNENKIEKKEEQKPLTSYEVGKYNYERIVNYLKNNPKSKPKDVARDLDVTIVTVHKHAKRMGWKFKKDLTKADKIGINNRNLVKKHVKDNPNATIDEISHNTDLSITTVIKHLIDLVIVRRNYSHTNRMRLSNRYVTRRR